MLGVLSIKIIFGKGKFINIFYDLFVLFQLSVSEKGLYKENSKDVADIIYNMANQPFVEIEQKDGGTQFKLTVDFPDNSHALLKPMRHPRSQVLLKL